jgi:hypothetical protein
MQVPTAIAAIAPDGKLAPRQRRQFLIEMCKRRIRPGTGSAPESLRRRTAMNPWPDLRGALEGIRWVIVGGVATRAYMPERATKDMDLLIRPEDEKPVLSRLQAAGYEVVSPLTMGGWLARSPEGVELDILLGHQEWLDEALAHPRLDPAGYPVIDLPYLVLMKMEASRSLDIGDLGRLLGLATEPELDRVRGVVRQYSPQDSKDLESLIYLGKLELGHV